MPSTARTTPAGRRARRVDEAAPDREVDLEALDPDEVAHVAAPGPAPIGAPDATRSGTPVLGTAIPRRAATSADADEHAAVLARRMEVAGDADAVERRPRAARPRADVHRERAARGEAAAGRRVAQVRRRTRDDVERPPVGVDVRERARAASACTGGAAPEDLVDRALLGDPPGVHDQHPVARLGDDRQVVGDEDQRQAELAAQVARGARRIWAWTMTSSAVVGSSPMTIAGSQASAIAIIARWRIPPDSSCG